MILALCFFLAGALVGIYMFVRHLMRRPLPKLAAVLHGFAGATGFAILLFTVVRMPSLVLGRYALIIFIAAILLGAVNLVFHIRGVRHKTVLILLHGLTAVIGASTLTYGIIVAALAAGSTSASAGPSASASAGNTASAPTQTSAAPAATEGGAPVASVARPAPTSSAAPSSTQSATLSMHPGPAWADRALTFEGSSAVLDASAKSNLADIAKELERHTEITLVEVQGHADERGADAFNLDLTRARAAAVADALVAQGIARSRLRSAGYGARCPADSNCQQASAPWSCHQGSSWQHDRRVALLILEAGGERFQGKVVCERGASLVPAEDKPYVSQ